MLALIWNLSACAPAVARDAQPDVLVPDKKTLTLAQHVRRNGYQTAGVTTNHLMLDRQGYARGFELYEKLGVDDTEVHPGQEVNDVVFLMSGPGVPAGQTVSDNVSQVDLVPTLTRLMGIRNVPQTVDGIDLAPGSGEALRERTVIGYRGGLKSIEAGTWMATEGPWKLMQWRGGDVLYKGDDEETNLLADPSAAEALSSLREDLDAYRATVVIRTPEETEIDVDDSSLQGLRALGYIE